MVLNIYSSGMFKSFAAEYGFKHVTSRPRYPQSIGTAERAVKTVRSMFEKNEDQYMALLILRSTPLENGFSPAELLMNRKVRTILPMTEAQFRGVGRPFGKRVLWYLCLR